MTIRRVVPLLAVLAALPVSALAVDKRQAERDALRAAVEDVVNTSALANARVGILVVGLEDGKVVYARNPDDLLNPASNVKLFTAAAALARLGPGYRFDTEFLIDKPEPKASQAPDFKPGEVKGPLYVRGTGDPTISSEKLWGIVNHLYFSGLRTIQGDLVLDDTYFDNERVGPGFDQERSDRAYLAPTGALSLNWNTVGIHVSPGEKVGDPAKVELDPPSDYFVLEVKAQTGKERSLRRLTISSVPFGDRQKIVVAGRIPLNQPPTSVWKKIDNPTLYFGLTLKDLLARRGITLKGRVRRGTVPSNPKDVKPLIYNRSETLDLVLKRLNKNSSNFTAEQLIKVLGAQTAGAPGSWPKGIAAVEEFLASEVGIARGTYVMKNGSGLNDTNRFSAAQTCLLLRHMWRRFNLSPEFLSSLPIGGTDGTLGSRLDGTEAVGRLRGKTGTLENVSALAGYVETVGGEKFAFAIFANDFPGRVSPVVQGIDAVGAAVASTGGASGPARGAALALGPKRQPGPLSELKARVALFDKLGADADPRNAVFLRTAMKSESDPALRAVIADAAFRSDPDDYSAARSLLDAFDTGPDVLGRLRAIGKDLNAPTPVLSSLVRIAGEGNADALSRLLEVAAQAKADAGLREELLEPLSEVARAAPDELITSLYAARPELRSDSLDVIAKALSKAAEPEHPFPLAVRRTQGSVNPDMAEFARQLDEELSIRIAAEKAPPVEPAQPPAQVIEQAKPSAEVRPGG